jgi:hypothetical protein|tara:strand:- start:27931 stop:28089 length:159 start_codon:yes stop_codon:yes gene_type:complete
LPPNKVTGDEFLANAEVNRAIEYGGVLLQLTQHLRQGLVEWLAKVRELRDDH